MATTPANVGRAFEAVTDCLSLANSLVTLIDETLCAYADDQDIREMAAESAITMEQLAARIPEAIKAAKALHMQFSTAFDTPAHAGGRSYASWHEAAINAANTLFVEICEAVDSDGWKKGDVVPSSTSWRLRATARNARPADASPAN